MNKLPVLSICVAVGLLGGTIYMSFRDRSRPAAPAGPTAQQFAAANEMTARQNFTIGLQSGYLLAMRGGTPQDCFVAVTSAETNRGAVVNAILAGRFPVKPASAQVAPPANLKPATGNLQPTK